MKLSDQSYISSRIQSAQSNSQGVNTPEGSGKPQEVSGHLKTEHDLNNESGLSSQYPMASEQEMRTRANPLGLRLFGNKPRRPPTTPPPPPPPTTPPPTPPPTTKPPTPPPTIKPPTPHNPTRPPIPGGGPNGAGNAFNSSTGLASVHNKKAFPPLSSQLAANARSSFVSAGVSTLINLPFSVAEHIASKAIVDRIDAQAKMPGAEKKNADGTVSTNDPSATEQQKLEARLEGAEVKTELMVNTILIVNEGPDANAIGTDPKAAKDVDSRLTALESRMSATENQMKEIAERYDLVYKPYKAPTSSEAPTAKSRMEVIEQRYAHMNKMVNRLKTNAEADAKLLNKSSAQAR